MDDISMNVFFFDLDGTLREPASGNNFITHPGDQKPLPGAKEAVQYYAGIGVCFGITNQGGVEAGHKDINGCIHVQRNTLKLFPDLEAILFCPDFAGQYCFMVLPDGRLIDIAVKYPSQKGTFRKPGAGMVHAILIRLNVPEKANICFFGDRPEDMGCAKAANIDFMWAGAMRSRFTKLNNQGGRYATPN